jgi:cyclohexanecarboxylate-CoA ligase
VLLLYTSGTTAAPKGVVHTHNTLDYEIRSVIEFFGLSRSDVVFMPSPVGHITGVVCGILLPVRLGTTSVLLDVWDPGRALSLITAHRCSYTVAATPFLHGIVHHPDLTETDVSALRVFMCGGADMPPELITSASEALDCMVTRAYGSTEYPSATGCNQDDPPDKRARTDGRAMRAVQLRVVDESGSDAPAGAVGDVLVRGPELFVGYFDTSLNDDAFTSDGWFRTGDIGRLDADGYLEITGRRKDIIIRGGENISVKEIEDHLFGHSKIGDVAVVAAPDPVLGERVCAVVVPKPGQTVTLDEVTEWLRAAKFAKQKLPERLILLDELPRTASGKVQKFKLRELARTSQ